MMMLHIARLRSPSGRKLTTGLAIRSSRKISSDSETTNKIASVCTRQNGSPNQSHCCPLLSITSQHDRQIASSPSPMVSKLSGLLASSARCCFR